MKTYTEYHIFSNEVDEWTKDKAEAMKIYQEFKKDNGSARLYEDQRSKDGELLNENCIKSYGSYPL